MSNMKYDEILGSITSARILFNSNVRFKKIKKNITGGNQDSFDYSIVENEMPRFVYLLNKLNKLGTLIARNVIKRQKYTHLELKHGCCELDSIAKKVLNVDSDIDIIYFPKINLTINNISEWPNTCIIKTYECKNEDVFMNNWCKFLKTYNINVNITTKINEILKLHDYNIIKKFIPFGGENDRFNPGSFGYILCEKKET